MDRWVAKCLCVSCVCGASVVLVVVVMVCERCVKCVRCVCVCVCEKCGGVSDGSGVRWGGLGRRGRQRSPS